MIKAVLIPPSVRAGIRPHQSPYKDAEIWGADFETVDGEPYTIQVHHPGGDYFAYLERPADGLWHLLDLVEERGATLIRCYWWALFYDLPCLLFGALRYFKMRDFNITCRYGGRNVAVSVSCDKSWFGTIRWGKKYRIELLDGFQFFRTSLDNAAKLMGNVRKYTRPKGLGQKKLKGKRFQEYAKRDARITYKIGLKIEQECKREGISACVSASQFASKVFRSNYLKSPIEYVIRPLERAAMLAYHGGLNWVTPRAPGLFTNVTEYDISSAYPQAFNQLPNFCSTTARWTRNARHPERRHGFVRVRFGSQCGFYGVRGHDFSCIEKGNVWCTTYEYRSCHGCLREAEIVDSWTWNGGGESPFKRYMIDFYKRKQDAPNGVRRYFAKICLNGLYGKLIQNKERDNGVFIAGGMFNPALASLVTGFTRARMHTLLHQYNGIHCATDSIFTREKKVPTSKGIGALERGTTGDLLLLRNKLYIFFKRGTREILKWGAHGFWGTKEDLIRLWRTRETRYTIGHIFKVREAFVQGRKPLRMEQVERKLKVCWDDFVSEQKEDPANGR